MTDEITLGDYVLTGGELAAKTMIDATVRLIPEVIGKESSHQDDSFSSGLLEYPQYTLLVFLFNLLQHFLFFCCQLIVF